MMTPAKGYAGIFFVAAATLLFEITLTRVFSVLFFHHFVFLIISTALFGFGFSGIYLLLRKPPARVARALAICSLLFSLTILASYKIILLLPLYYQTIAGDPTQVVRLVFYYALLAVPFFFSGYVIALLLSSFPESSGRYYAFDLAGAALGCLSVLWLIPALGASGAIVLASLIAAVGSLIFWPPSRILKTVSVAAIAIALFLLPQAEEFYSLPLSRIFEEKHGNFLRAPTRTVEFSAWSPVSRIDILVTPPMRTIYLDGGSNVSFLIRQRGKRLRGRSNYRSVPYLLGQPKSACIIGPGGGEDVLIALTHGTKQIDAVEMDPLIVDIVQGRYHKFIGGIFKRPGVELYNDEGRSFLRRSGKKYDLIQTVHNCSPMALASGAFNLSESYLFTVEAFREYWDKLNPNGILAINRSGIVRAASIASQALEQEGISDPQNYVIVTSRAQTGGDTGFFLKKGRITREDIRRLHEIKDETRVQIEYIPTPQFQNSENAYYRLLVPKLREEFIQTADINLQPSTDNWPFFDHYQRVGSFQSSTTVLPKDLNEALKFHNMGDLALFTVLAEVGILSFLFILWPLFRFRSARPSFSHWTVLVYFSALGIGFILIEVSLFQKHILFLGQPVYSISAVLFSVLLSAGVGSLFFQKFFREGQERKWLRALGAALTVLILFEVFLVPKLFDYFLGAPKAARFILSGLFIMPLGLVLGVPFPLGIRILGTRYSEMIPWGWGLNAYTTVLGSILCVLFALLFGFRFNFFAALAIYLTGFTLMARKV